MSDETTSSAKKRKNAPFKPRAPTTEAAAHPPSAPSHRHPQGSWECPTCALTNGRKYSKCPCCDTARPIAGSFAIGLAPSAGPTRGIRRATRWVAGREHHRLRPDDWRPRPPQEAAPGFPFGAPAGGSQPPHPAFSGGAALPRAQAAVAKMAPSSGFGSAANGVSGAHPTTVFGGVLSGPRATVFGGGATNGFSVGVTSPATKDRRIVRAKPRAANQNPFKRPSSTAADAPQPFRFVHSSLKSKNESASVSVNSSAFGQPTCAVSNGAKDNKCPRWKQGAPSACTPARSAGTGATPRAPEKRKPAASTASGVAAGFRFGLESSEKKARTTPPAFGFTFAAPGSWTCPTCGILNGPQSPAAAAGTTIFGASSSKSGSTGKAVCRVVKRLAAGVDRRLVSVQPRRQIQERPTWGVASTPSVGGAQPESSGPAFTFSAPAPSSPKPTPVGSTRSIGTRAIISGAPSVTEGAFSVGAAPQASKNRRIVKARGRKR